MKSKMSKLTTEKDIREKIKEAVEKKDLKEGGVQYFVQMYSGTKFMPTAEEIKRIMYHGEGYYY